MAVLGRQSQSTFSKEVRMGSTIIGSPNHFRTRSAQGATSTRRGRSGSSSEEPAVTTLSRREREVLALIATGMTDRQIADELIVSRVTISTHVAHILAKLGVP